MFVSNKYRTWYARIIDAALSQGRSKAEGYFESHHVLPESLFGGLGRRVLLTPREHFVCHWLLTKFTAGQDRKKMCHALNEMANHRMPGRPRWTSIEYEAARRAAVAAMTGRVVSAETRRRISASKTGKKMPPRSLEHRRKISVCRKGKPLSAEHRAKIGLRSSERTWWTDGTESTLKKDCPPGWRKGRTIPYDRHSS